MIFYVQIISQRLTKLFQIVIEENKPVSVSELASLLGVSRRTIFRELENIDVVLKKYDLSLETSAKEGLFLKGEKSKIQKFAQEIAPSASNSSINKDERRSALAFALLNSTHWQKLYYYSSLLEVSEATVSLDIDTLQTEFRQFNVEIQRKKGVGILAVGSEKNIRIALVSYMSKNNDNSESLALKYSFPELAVEQEVKSILAFLSMQLDWITLDTIKLLEYRLCVQVTRVSKGCLVPPKAEVDLNGVLGQLAMRIADEIEKRFAIELPDFEVQRIVTSLRSARAKQKKPISEKEEIEAYNKVRNLSFLLIEKFDPRLAPVLKTNEEFVRGISIHLWSAIERLKIGYIIDDPLKGKIKETYPDIYERTKNAVTILETELSRQVPEGEIACLATHFGAAVMQIGQDKLKRRLKVGIVCVGGIGVSYMLNSQIKKRFSNELITEISEYNNKEQWAKNDFIISTIPLDFNDKIVINVNAILSNKDYESIRNTIESLRAQTRLAENYIDVDFLSNIEKSIFHLKEVHSILQKFKVITVSDLSTVEDLSKFVGHRFGADSSSAQQIYVDLIKRENISSQLIEELDLVLLHSITGGADKPVVAIVYPQNLSFENDEGKKANTCLLILLPMNASSELKEAIGLLSAALIEEGDFLSCILQRDEKMIHKKIETILQTHLRAYMKANYNNN